MLRAGCLLLIALIAGCATGGGEEASPSGDASVDARRDARADSSGPDAASCDPAADICPPEQHCSPLTRQCIAGCRNDTGCSKGKCDVANHECVGCVTGADCPAGQLCSGTVCVAGCAPERPCPSGLTCCSGGCIDSSTNIDHCGACGTKCAIANATAACASGTCTIAICRAPFADCDGSAANGCETDTSSSNIHCGACGSSCAPANGVGSCALGSCRLARCSAGFGDCNASVGDGCEANLASDPNNCGTCGNKPTEACNLRDDNCNGACDDVDGCRVGIHRSAGSEYFYTNSSTEAACCGFRVEALNYFYLYNAGGEGRTAFYRCYNPTPGRHFYTTSSTCEVWGADKVESIIGQIGTSASCGSVPLYRLYSSSSGHLFTTEASERSSKISAGWKDEGIAGYVWKAPRG